MKIDDPLVIIVIIGIAFLIGYGSGLFVDKYDTEKKCIYENRLEFSGQTFSCQWMPGVTTTGGLK